VLSRPGATVRRVKTKPVTTPAFRRGPLRLAVSIATLLLVVAVSSPAAPGLINTETRLARYPTSYFAGPAGERNILPPRKGAFLGIYPGGRFKTWAQLKRQFLSRSRYAGRRLDIMGLHYGAPAGACFNPGYAPFSVGHEAWVRRHGALPYVTWSPHFSLDQINAGQADACFRDVAQRAKAYGRRVFWRMYWEFNGNWYPWAYGGDPAKLVAAWRRTVDIFRASGATNLIWVWSPDEGWYRGDAPKGFQAYPGDAYVDWVASDGYNWFTRTAWCGAMDHPHPGWCQFEEIFHGSLSAGKSVELDFRGRKPYMVAETGSVEDAARLRRKGRWFRYARDAIKARFRGLRALVYFDQNTSSTEGCRCNWRIDSSRASLRGFRALARDLYFRTRR
jgi:Glycosyl hydrolase family 26